MFAVTVLLCAAAISVPPPNPIIQAAPLMKLVNQTTTGKLYTIDQGTVHLKVLHIWGRPEELGYAQGYLLAKDIYQFMVVELDKFYAELADQIPLGDLPAWLQKDIQNAIGSELVPVMHKALAYVYDRELYHILLSESSPSTEADTMARGMCDSGVIFNCSVNEIAKVIKHSNMLPELIRMTCSMMGAWGKATPTGKLTQLRTLDFGTGPFASYSTLTVYHPLTGFNWANIGFPGFVGSVTGFSEHVALSEKVWEHYGPGKDTQPGHYDGLPVTGVIRNILQYSATKEQAHNYALDHKRTWGVFMGVGDDSSQQFKAIGYREADCKWYGDNNITMITNFTTVEGVTYIDKHPQPSHDRTTMPGLVNTWYGNLTAVNVVQNFPRFEKSGDVHAAVFDYGNKKTYMAFGVVDANGQYGPNDEGFACYQPFLEFDQTALWNEPRPL
eukprot:TRINITY_DN30827_c0_g1_i1.p1 TRINITY_DN30827_c0_g1~~TRINITY_DN30827_c0_g1_i1.p1  ORF type:complete len:462 (+),score=116.76 TRINITY_DN30827_c0_g1_i1:60-1388(+)